MFPALYYLWLHSYKEFYMEITMENYYDNLKAHGYTEDDLPMLSSKGSQQYSDAMSNFDDSWEPFG